MFRGCARPERNVFVTREECDVDEQDVGERKECWGRKRVLSHIWVISESYLSQTWCELIRASALFSLGTLVTVDSIENIYIFFLYASAVSQSITHLINVIIINILIIHSDRFWKINVQQKHTLFDDEMLTNHIHLDIDIHMNLCFCLLIFLNYVLSIYKSLYEENFLFFSRWFEVFIKSLSFLEILRWFICDIKSMNTQFASNSFDLFLIFSSLQSIK